MRGLAWRTSSRWSAVAVWDGGTCGAFVELARVRPGLIELAAVVDVDRDRADFVAGEVEELFGNRPVACASIA